MKFGVYVTYESITIKDSDRIGIGGKGNSLFVRPARCLSLFLVRSPDGGLPLVAPPRGCEAVEGLVQRVVEGLK